MAHEMTIHVLSSSSTDDDDEIPGMRKRKSGKVRIMEKATDLEDPEGLHASSPQLAESEQGEFEESTLDFMGLTEEGESEYRGSTSSHGSRSSRSSRSSREKIPKPSILSFRLSTFEEIVEEETDEDSDTYSDSSAEQEAIKKISALYASLVPEGDTRTVARSQSFRRSRSVLAIDADWGRFVDPLTGRFLTSSSTSESVEEEVVPEAVEEEVEEEEVVEDQDLLETAVVMDDDFVAVEDDDTFKTFFEMEREVKVKIRESFDADQLEKELEMRQIATDTRTFMHLLIDRVVEVAEYVDPILILRENLDKTKLAGEIVKSLKDLEMARKTRTFLNRKVIDYFRRKKSMRALADDNAATITADITKYNEALSHLDHLLSRESEARNITSTNLRELEEQREELEDVMHNEVTSFEDLVKKTLLRENFERMKAVVEYFLRKMGSLRSEVSNERLLFIQRQHTYASLIDKLTQLEDLGNGLSMRDFEQLRAETQTLGKKIEERNTELNRWRSRCNADIHIMAHTREKQQMLRNAIAIQQAVLEELGEEKNDNRAFLYDLKITRDHIRKEINDLSFQGGLIDKPALMLDYDETTDKLEKVRQRVSALHSKYNNYKMKLEKLTARYKQLLEEIGELNE